MILTTPFKTEDLLNLKIGDRVLLSGTIFTIKDKAHKYLIENDFEEIKNSVIYHCGPIVKNGEIITAGPTTSHRFDSYTPKLIEKFQIKAIIGKGGMDASSLKSLKGKIVYFSAIGGAGVIYAKTIQSAKKLVFPNEELCKKISHEVQQNPNQKYPPISKPFIEESEAIWKFEVKEFPVVVAIDANGNNLYENVYKNSVSSFLKLTNRHIA